MANHAAASGRTQHMPGPPAPFSQAAGAVDMRDRRADVATLQGLLDEIQRAKARGEYRIGASLAQQAAVIAGDLGDRHQQAAALISLADQQHCLGEHEAAVASYGEALQLF